MIEGRIVPDSADEGHSDPLRSSRLLHQLLDRLPAGAYITNAQGLITYFNTHAERMWGRAPKLEDPAERFCGSFKLYLADGTPVPHEQCWTALALETEREYDGREIVIEKPDGSRVFALAHVNPIHDEAGQLLGAINVFVDITDQKLAQQAFRDAYRAKDDFIATMSHEIRTPLNAIIGYADLLAVEIAGPLTDTQHAHLMRIRQASDHLLTLVNEVLDLAKVESELELRRERHAAHAAIRGAFAVVQPQAIGRGITLHDATGAAAPLLYVGDEERVRQLLVHLIANALKFSEAGTRIVVSARSVDGALPGAAGGADVSEWIAISVQDAGIGIAAEQMERIFEPFVQLESALTRTRGGTGLGLTVSRRLARLMGGELTVESTVGVGSTFTLWLPAAADIDGEEPRGAADLTAEPAWGEGPPHAAAVGRVLLGCVNDIVHAHADRLRAERTGPGADVLSNAQLSNRLATLLCDVAVTLLAFDERDTGLATLASSNEIQRVCAEDHGRQRARLGWSDASLVREYDVLWEAVESRLLAATTGEDAAAALRAVRVRLHQACAHSVGALQLARRDG